AWSLRGGSASGPRATNFASRIAGTLASEFRNARELESEQTGRLVAARGRSARSPVEGRPSSVPTGPEVGTRPIALTTGPPHGRVRGKWQSPHVPPRRDQHRSRRLRGSGRLKGSPPILDPRALSTETATTA